jgi:hypothetical protein
MPSKIISIRVSEPVYTQLTELSKAKGYADKTAGIKKLLEYCVRYPQYMLQVI